MSESKHSPGRWRVCKAFSSEDPSLLIAADSTPAERHKYPHSIGKWIATVRCGSVQEQEANARVMAAAPRLLASLKTMMDGCNEDNHQMGCENNDCEFCEARAAIAEAEGREA